MTERVIAGRYRLLRPLGRGGMGAVWLAEDQLAGRQVAVKELRAPDGVSDADRDAFMRRALQEARSAARLTHPNAVTLHDIIPPGPADDAVYLIMEFVDGLSLAQLVQRDGPLSEAQVTGIALQLLAILDAAHALGIVHRDIKPANVMVTAGGQVKLTDFGIAHMVGGTRLTGSGVIGTPAYMAPEQLQGLPITPAVDLWALGVTLYDLVTGHNPFDRDNTATTFHAILMSELPPPPGGPPLGPVIGALLVRDPAQRMTTAQARPLLSGPAGWGGGGSPASGAGNSWSGAAGAPGGAGNSWAGAPGAPSGAGNSWSGAAGAPGGAGNSWGGAAGAPGAPSGAGGSWGAPGGPAGTRLGPPTFPTDPGAGHGRHPETVATRQVGGSRRRLAVIAAVVVVVVGAGAAIAATTLGSGSSGTTGAGKPTVSASTRPTGMPSSGSGPSGTASASSSDPVSTGGASTPAARAGFASPSATLAAIPDSFLGTWTGTITDKTGSSQPAMLTLTGTGTSGGDIGTVKYPDAAVGTGCSYDLHGISASANQVELYEELDGTGLCDTLEYVVLTRTSSGLREDVYGATPVDGSTPDFTGTLTKS